MKKCKIKENYIVILKLREMCVNKVYKHNDITVKHIKLSRESILDTKRINKAGSEQFRKQKEEEDTVRTLKYVNQKFQNNHNVTKQKTSHVTDYKIHRLFRVIR